MIQEQIKLPLKIAFNVVMQGIRIRFGRSVVTVTGVIFGIAFLMSILTGQIVKEGVTEEEQMRTEVKRMMNFLTSEIGSIKDRTLGIIQVGSLNEEERRFLVQCEKDGAARMLFARIAEQQDRELTIGKQSEVVEVDPTQVGADSSGVVVMGEGEIPDLAWGAIMAEARQNVVAFTRKYAAPRMDGARTIQLQRELQPDEIAKMEKEREKTKFRNIWIIVISLLVTVMGISNAMLMSVTERFREIGTMKCLGALSRFIRKVFLIEAFLIGAVGSLMGSIVGAAFSIVIYSLTYGVGLVLSSLQIWLLLIFFAAALVVGMILTILAAIYPASVAAGMVPAHALRSNV